MRRAEDHHNQAVDRSATDRELSWHKRHSEEDKPYISPVGDACDELLESGTLDVWAIEAQTVRIP